LVVLAAALVVNETEVLLLLRLMVAVRQQHRLALMELQELQTQAVEVEVVHITTLPLGRLVATEVLEL
jgi:hypothetical protein